MIHKRSTTTKKATKKAAVKTAVAKRASNVKPRKAAIQKKADRTKPQHLVVAKDSQCFWMTDGSVLRDLTDLEVAFGAMGDTVFLYHANRHKNDFAEWVEHVLKDAACAAELRRSKKPTTARVVVRRFIRRYT